jgi:predicted RNase H-like HicB family nuclease
MKYHFKIHKEDNGFWAECLELAGCVTQGNSREELADNMQEALNLYLEEPESVTYLPPFPDNTYKLSSSIVEVTAHPAIAFGLLVRYYRVKNGLTQKEAAKHLGIKNIFSYQRLERRCNATIEIIGKLLSLFPELPLQQIFN